MSVHPSHPSHPCKRLTGRAEANGEREIVGRLLTADVRRGSDAEDDGEEGEGLREREGREEGGKVAVMGQAAGNGRGLAGSGRLLNSDREEGEGERGHDKGERREGENSSRPLPEKTLPTGEDATRHCRGHHHLCLPYSSVSCFPPFPPFVREDTAAATAISISVFPVPTFPSLPAHCRRRRCRCHICLPSSSVSLPFCPLPEKTLPLPLPLPSLSSPFQHRLPGEKKEKAGEVASMSVAVTMTKSIVAKTDDASPALPSPLSSPTPLSR